MASMFQGLFGQSMVTKTPSFFTVKPPNAIARIKLKELKTLLGIGALGPKILQIVLLIISNPYSLPQAPANLSRLCPPFKMLLPWI